MKKIKFYNSKTDKFGKEIRLDGVTYKGYTVGKLPNKFAYIFDELNDREGTTEWFNYKGLTFIEKVEGGW